MSSVSVERLQARIEKLEAALRVIAGVDPAPALSSPPDRFIVSLPVVTLAKSALEDKS